MNFSNNHIVEKLKLVKQPPKKEQPSVNYTEFQNLNDFRTIYTDASNRLRDQPYALQKRALFQTASVWKVVYPPLSFLLGLGSILLFATTLSGERTLYALSEAKNSTLANILFVGIGLLFLLVGIEVIKALQASNVFRAQAKKQGVKAVTKVLLGVVMISSILLSGIGGMYVSYELGDKSRGLKTGLQKQVDSIRAVYISKNAQNDKIIQGLQNMQINAKLRRWGLTKEESEQLRLAQAEKKHLALAQERALANTRSQYGKIIKQSVSYTSVTMFMVMVIVALMELLNLWSYYFIWTYRKRVADEGMQFGILPVVEDKLPVVIKKTTTTESTPTVDDTNRNYDFATDAAAIGAEIKCNNEKCSNLFQKRSYNHRFCSDQCRLDFHGFDVRRHRKRE